MERLGRRFAKWNHKEEVAHSRTAPALGVTYQPEGRYFYSWRYFDRGQMGLCPNGRLSRRQKDCQNQNLQIKVSINALPKSIARSRRDDSNDEINCEKRPSEEKLRKNEFGNLAK